MPAGGKLGLMVSEQRCLLLICLMLFNERCGGMGKIFWQNKVFNRLENSS